MSSEQYYNAPPGPPPSQAQRQEYNQQQQPSYHNQQSQQSEAPPFPPRQTQQSDPFGAVDNHAEQVETMQNYESSARHTRADDDQAQLQREFPNVDSSLIAALYSDSGSLGATKEILMELAEQEGSSAT